MRSLRPDFSRWLLGIAAVAALMALPGQISRADEGGVSFWIPGFFGSLAATPATPGWSGTSIYYHDSVSAGGNVALARQFEIRTVPVNLTASFTGNVNTSVNLDLFAATYTFATPVLGAQASFSLLSVYAPTRHRSRERLREHWQDRSAALFHSRAPMASPARSWHLVTCSPCSS